MLPVMVRRQVINRQCREMGLLPMDSYQPKVGIDDEIVIMEVHREPEFRVNHFHGVVVGVMEHGHYRDVYYERDDGFVGVARVNTNGVPPDWGVIALRVTRRVHYVLPHSKGRI